jgi:hypothetical protein
MQQSQRWNHRLYLHTAQPKIEPPIIPTFIRDRDRTTDYSYMHQSQIWNYRLASRITARERDEPTDYIYMQHSPSQNHRLKLNAAEPEMEPPFIPTCSTAKDGTIDYIFMMQSQKWNLKCTTNRGRTTVYT